MELFAPTLQNFQWLHAFWILNVLEPSFQKIALYFQ